MKNRVYFHYLHGVSAFLLLLTLFVAANAQEFRGSITGKVMDPNGAVLPGATVTLKNIATNLEATALTNADGSYNFALLSPGKYAMTVTAQGFNTAMREGIEVRVADRLTVDVPLQAAGVAAMVNIVSGPVLEAGNVSTGTVIDNRQISELPLTEGSAYQLATLAPGIAYTGNPLFTGPTSNGNLAAFRSNGATGSNQITLDGSPNYAFDGAVGFSPPSDAVQEFKVQTNTFDAQQGYSAGATVNVAVKSGGNDFHGSLWYFNRDRSRSANNFFSNRSGIERPERTYHRFGGVLNGPVRIPGLYDGSNKTFFLLSYERLLDNVAEPQLFTVPTAAMRTGDFSALIVNRNNIADAANTIIYNPFSGTTSGSNVVRTSFGCPASGAVPVGSTCNMIPTSLINPVAAALVKYYPLPNAPGVGGGTQNNFFSNQIRHQKYRAWLMRVDHKLSENQSIFGKYYHSFNPEDRQDWAGEVNGFPITQGFEFRTNDGGNVDYTVALSNSMVFDLRASFNRFEQERRPAESFDPATLGFAPASLPAFRGYDYLPRIMIRNLDATRPIRSTLGATRSDWNAGRLRPFMMGSIQPTMTQVIGNHSAKYGYDLRILRENFISNGYQGGQFFFDGLYTSPASNSSTTLRNTFGRDIAAFILGIPTTGSGGNSSIIDNSINYSVQSVYHGFFIQDDWRVTPKLTLNLGVRYELEQGLTERYNRIQHGFDLATPSPVEAAARAAYTTIYNASSFPVAPANFHVIGGYRFADENNRNVWNADTGNIQPRIGVAYKLDDKTVLRAGFGIFMAPFQIETPQQVGFAGNTAFVPTNNNGLTFVATLTNPFPSGASSLNVSPGSSLGLLTGLGADVGASDAAALPLARKNSKFSRLVFGFQRELPGQFVIEANFITAWGRDLAVNRNLNFVPRQFPCPGLAGATSPCSLGETPATDTAISNYLSASLGANTNPFRNLLPGTGSPLNTATTMTRAQSLLAFPQFTNLFVQQYNGTNRYNSLQLQAIKRFAKDLSFNASYTYSNLRERVNYLNPSNAELEDRISQFDRPHRFTFSGTYQLPLGRGRAFGGDMNRILDAIIGGWQLNGTYEWQSGEPFLLTAAPLYYSGDVSELRGLIGESDGQGGKYGIDRSAIVAPGTLVSLTAFGIRNVPTTLSNLRNQPYSVANLSITKNFKFGETKRLQIRGEALNAFNRPYFGFGAGLNPGPLGTPNAAFGLVTTQRNNPRDIQLGVKFVF
ncbi:MAG: carboxypeptidase-like regulatory domain-containing protein [Pyrinomonadaceae bacterium]